MLTRTSGLCLALLMVCGLVLLPACQTDTGAKSNRLQQWRNIEGDTKEVTEAAREVLEEMDLRDVKAASTSVDGQASGKMADGTEVWVTSKRVTDNTSEVTVQIGKLGNPSLGDEILAKVQQRVSGG